MLQPLRQPFRAAGMARRENGLYAASPNTQKASGMVEACSGLPSPPEARLASLGKCSPDGAMALSTWHLGHTTRPARVVIPKVRQSCETVGEPAAIALCCLQSAEIADLGLDRQYTSDLAELRAAVLTLGGCTCGQEAVAGARRELREAWFTSFHPAPLAHALHPQQRSAGSRSGPAHAR